jgi:hypothetical protein
MRRRFRGGPGGSRAEPTGPRRAHQPADALVSLWALPSAGPHKHICSIHLPVPEIASRAGELLRLRRLARCCGALWLGILSTRARVKQLVPLWRSRVRWRRQGRWLPDPRALGLAGTSPPSPGTRRVVTSHPSLESRGRRTVFLPAYQRQNRNRSTQRIAVVRPTPPNARIPHPWLPSAGAAPRSGVCARPTGNMRRYWPATTAARTAVTHPTKLRRFNEPRSFLGPPRPRSSLLTS